MGKLSKIFMIQEGEDLKRGVTKFMGVKTTVGAMVQIHYLHHNAVYYLQTLQDGNGYIGCIARFEITSFISAFHKF